jgi:tRNA(adenine34) deaminase
MQEALKEAQKAFIQKEIPVGAVVVLNHQIIGHGHNQTESKQSTLFHAELVALRQASRRMHNWRLSNCELYVTLEPCTMCAGAIMLSRIRRLIYATPDPKAGAVQSTIAVLDNPALNHRVEVIQNILSKESSDLLKSFFKQLRQKKFC